MSCSADYIEFISQQISAVGVVRPMKMMGDYIIYVDEKPALTVCDNICYVKKIPEIASLMADAECGCPYSGAKEHYILDIEHRSFATQVVAILRDTLPYPKKRKK